MGLDPVGGVALAREQAPRWTGKCCEQHLGRALAGGRVTALLLGFAARIELAGPLALQRVNLVQS